MTPVQPVQLDPLGVELEPATANTGGGCANKDAEDCSFYLQLLVRLLRPGLRAQLSLASLLLHPGHT